MVIEGQRIADIGPAAQLAVDETIDASGLYLLPGVIDDQVHFREVSFADAHRLWLERECHLAQFRQGLDTHFA